MAATAQTPETELRLTLERRLLPTKDRGHLLVVFLGSG